MKTNSHHVLRAAALTAALLALPIFASAKDTASTDGAAELLARHATVPVTGVGSYVEVGTYLIQVAVKLGPPTAKLPDGTWLYHNYQVAGSDARGTLVVRFRQGRVSDLALVSPAVATAMIAPQKAADPLLIANHR